MIRGFSAWGLATFHSRRDSVVRDHCFDLACTTDLYVGRLLVSEPASFPHSARRQSNVIEVESRTVFALRSKADQLWRLRKEGPKRPFESC